MSDQPIPQWKVDKLRKLKPHPNCEAFSEEMFNALRNFVLLDNFLRFNQTPDAELTFERLMRAAKKVVFKVMDAEEVKEATALTQ